MTTCGVRVAFTSLWVAMVLTAAPAAGQIPPGTPERTGHISGRVTQSGGSPLPWAWIRVAGFGAPRHTMADSLGRYRLDAPAGSAVLRVEALGHRPTSIEVLVPAEASITVDVALEQHPLDLPGFVVVAEPFVIAGPDGRSLPPLTQLDPSITMAVLTLDAGLADIAAGAGAAGDPGDPPTSDGSQVLLMRGSTADLKLLLLDGAPVYTPFHLGGVLESFDLDVLGRAAHYVGAAPARYDGGLDYILDLETRRPGTRPSAIRGALDLMSARASAEWGGESGGLLASGRALHGAGTRWLEGVRNPYGYADGLVRGAWRVGGLDLSATGFANRESVALGLPDAPAVPSEAAWSNRALSTRLVHRTGSAEVEWMLAASRYDAALPLQADTSLTVVRNPVLAEGRTGRLRATMDARLPAGGGTLRLGASADRMASTYGSSLRTPRGYLRSDTRSEGWTAGAHAEMIRALGPGVVGRLGARADHFAPGGTRGALRGSLVWSLTPTAALTLAAGRYHQFTRSPAGPLEDALVQALDSVALPSSGTSIPLAVATADHVLVGLDQTLTPATRLGLQGYVKRFRGLGTSAATRTSSGIDVRLRAGRGERSGWVGYALNWTWEDDPGSIDTQRFIGRHVMSTGYRGPLYGPLGLEARLAFSDGLPLTSVPLGSRNAQASDASIPPLEAGPGQEPVLGGDQDGFLRLDLELFGEWSAPMGQGRIRPYIRLLNALDQRDAQFYYFEPWRSPELRPLARRGVLPVVGVAWRF